MHYAVLLQTSSSWHSRSSNLKTEVMIEKSGCEKLRAVKQRTWFYEFELPDGTRTRTDLPEHWRPVHYTRQRYLLNVIHKYVPDAAGLTAADFASHEGYFSIELAKHFSFVRGFEIRRESVEAAKLITDVLGLRNVEYVAADLQTMTLDERFCTDFVLVYGLIYHMEDPIHVLRLASQLSRKHILVETQVFPYDVRGRIEDGGYENQRQVEGMFALAPDYPSGREGGSTSLALVPSLNALIFLLKHLGFEYVTVLQPVEQDYEQYRRGSRVVVYGRKSPIPPASQRRLCSA
jgi:tRNA (mo5U34)-methyltransferase